MTIEPPCLQRHFALVDPGDLVLELVLVEQRLLAFVELQPVDVARHDDLQELLGPLVGRRLVDVDRVDVAGEDVADRADDHVAFFVDVDRRRLLLDPADDHLPQPQQVGQVARQLLLGAVDAGGADDEAQPLGRIQLEHACRGACGGRRRLRSCARRRRGPAPASAPGSGREC